MLALDFKLCPYMHTYRTAGTYNDNKFGNLEVEDELLQITIIMMTFCLCFHYPKSLNTKFSPVNQL
jgi:hypothetical protein